MANRTDSPQAWKDYWFNKASPDNALHYRGMDEKLYGYEDWIDGREVRMSKMPGVPENVVLSVRHGIQDALDRVGLNFDITYIGAHPSIIEQVREATKHDGTIDAGKLSKILIAESWRKPSEGGKPHADVLVLDKYLHGSQNDWGQSEFGMGYVFLSLPPNRQNSTGYLRNIAKHEGGHLFGYQAHHGWDDTNVRGYPNTPACNMTRSASTLDTCHKCTDAMTALWKGIEQRSGRRYLK